MRFLAGLVALLVVACRTHEVDDCRPACGDAEVAGFVACVAGGLRDASGAMLCEAGNRRCCALAADCVGNLDDQTVVTTVPDCPDFVTDTSCWPPCNADDVADYELCLVGSTGVCAVDDFECCALAVDCLGDLGDVIVSADGCCSDSTECAIDEACDPMTWTCEPTTSPTCGDDAITGTEECDDGNTFTESCTYGETSCTVCNAACAFEDGATSYCGDDVVDETHGEDCEPPGTRVCDASCAFIAVPTHCSDGGQTGDETDVDCGGSCPGCLSGFGCNTVADCRVEAPECSSTLVCDAAKGLCGEFSVCDDLDDCTVDRCVVGSGCDNTTPTDIDMDGHFPMNLGCGDDCDDFDDTVNPGISFDLGCSTADSGFGVDNDCDLAIDEDC